MIINKHQYEELKANAINCLVLKNCEKCRLQDGTVIINYGGTYERKDNNRAN